MTELAAIARDIRERTRREQGLSVTLTDPAALDRLAVLIDEPEIEQLKAAS